MGNQASIQRHISEEFKRVKEATKKKYVKNYDKDYLVLDQVLQMQPFREHPVDIAHLGTLFVLDKDKDGRFTEQEFIAFAQMFASKKTITADFQAHLQAFCTLRMWNEVGKGNSGVQLFEEWFGRLFTENSAEAKTVRTDDGRKITLVEGDSAKTLHKLLNIKLMYGYGFQGFLELMQQAAEEKKLMSSDNKKLKEYVPLIILKDFGREFMLGFSRVMRDMGFDSNLRVEVVQPDTVT